MADYINVTSLNRLAKRVLEQCDPLNDLIVCGEISGFTRHYKSGHLYFTLKDENASIKTVMFRSQAQLLNFEPQNGMLVLVYGRATIYERDGAFQLYADYMKPFGAGAAQMAFDALYKKLEAEGLFAPAARRTEVYRRCHEQDRRSVAGRAERHWPSLANGEIVAGPRQRAGHRG